MIVAKVGANRAAISISVRDWISVSKERLFFFWMVIARPLIVDNGIYLSCW
jgi:hypothetical protein